MTLRFAESFDRWASTGDMVRGLQLLNTGGSINSTGGVWNGGYYYGGDLNPGTWVPFFSQVSGTTLRWAYWIKIGSGYVFGNTVHRPITEFKDREVGATRFLHMRLTGSGATSRMVAGKYDDASNAATVATGTTQIADDTWKHVECEFVADPTSGTFKTWIDGVADINFSGDTTDAASGDVSSFTGMRFAGSSSNSSNDSVNFDDLIVWDDSGGAGAFKGRLPDKHRIRHITPAANGSQNDWTPTSGSNFENVDEAQVDDTATYNYTETVNAIDYYSFNNMSFNPLSIYAMVGEVFARRDGLRARGVFPKCRVKLKRSGGVQNGTAKNTVAKFRRYAIVTENDPVDGAPWTKGKFNTGQLEVGIEKTA